MLPHWMDFKAPGELWNPLNKTIPGKFHGSGRLSKCHCLQDLFHRSRAWQTVIILNTDNPIGNIGIITMEKITDMSFESRRKSHLMITPSQHVTCSLQQLLIKMDNHLFDIWDKLNNIAPFTWVMSVPRITDLFLCTETNDLYITGPLTSIIRI